MREWFQVKLQADDPTVAEIHIVDFIGDWYDQMLNEMFDESVTVTAKAFIQQLAKLPDSVKTLQVHVNSPGGDVFGAVNIANALRDQRATKGRVVETIVDGMAASAASLIVMAGSPVRIADNGILMIHDAWTIAAGNAKEMRKTADVLDKFRDTNIIPTYQWHTPLSAEDVAGLMAEETWMDAQEAVDYGFADEIVKGLKAAASIDPRAAAKLKVPEKYTDRVQALLRLEDAPAPAPEVLDRAPLPEPVSEPPAPAVADAADVVRLCGDAGLDLAFAQALIGEGLVIAGAEARITSEKETRVRAEARANDIRALCAKVKQDDLAHGYVAGGMSVEQVRDHLTKITAKLDRVEIDAGLAPDYGTRPKKVIDVVAVYAERNRLKN